MKKSKFFLILSLLSGLIFFISLISNETANPKTIDEIKKFTGEELIVISETLRNDIEIYRESKRERILTNFGIPFIICLLIFFIVKSSENKKDPLKNLESLKNSGVITNEEFIEKSVKSREQTAKEIKTRARNKEEKKLISELENLKNKGILNETEFKNKVQKIRNRTL